MSFDWPAVPLEELTDGTTITYGVVKPGDDCQDGVKFVRGGDVVAGRILTEQLRTITPEVSQQYARTLLRGGELLISLVGNPGEVALVPASLKGANIARQVGLVRVDATKADANYVQYFLRSKTGRDVLLAQSKGSVQQVINLKDLKSVKVPLPPINVQRRVSGFMQSLDGRITLLRETNATLEAIAQALFKSWFVDFDPVRAKMEGRAPEGMDEATAALFPDSFEESALGLVPRGWRVGMLGELARIHKGTTNPLSQPDVVFEHYSLPAFDSGQMPVLDRGSEIKSNKSPVPNKAVLLSKLNPHIPRVWLPSDSGKNAVCSTEFLVFTPTNGASREFVFCQFSTAQFQQALCQLVTGTSNSHQRVKADGVLAMSAVIPLPGAQVAFGDIIRPIFDRIGHNRQQAQTLATLRDTLLPRLISGQLRLPEAQAAAAEALA